MAGIAEPLDVDLSAERFGREIPFDDFARLRREAPVWWSETNECWNVTTHALVEQLNRDFATFASGRGVGPPKEGNGRRPSMLVSMDPPRHTSYRRAVAREFTPRAISSWEPDTRRIVRDVVGEFAASGGGDFVADVAARVPFRVIATLLGISFEDEQTLLTWSNTMSTSADPDYRPSPEAVADAVASIWEYAGQVIADHRDNPRDDLTTHLLSVEVDGARLDDDDLRNFVQTLIAGGSETTRNLITGGLLLLLENDAARAAYVSEEAETAPMIDEMLRFVSPVMHHSRHATRDVEVAGATIAAGDRVSLWMISANHDERVFAEPNRFIVDRSPNPHTALGGGGPHYCLGSSLAKLEATALFEGIRPLLDHIVLTGAAERVCSSFFNGFKRLPVEVRRAAAR